MTRPGQSAATRARTRATPRLNFVLVLHAHLPWVLNHGRWPHGTDWLAEATVDCYLPLLETIGRVGAPGSAPLTLSITPVLAAQMSAPEFGPVITSFLAQRIESCEESARGHTASGEHDLVRIAHWWRNWYLARRAQFESLDRGLVGALRDLEWQGRVELMSSAATHGFLPLLARDESIHLQLLVGRAEHERIFGRAPTGCWLPECAYRPAGPWSPWPGAPAWPERDGIEASLAHAGYRYVVVDSHVAAAGQPLEAYGQPRRAAQFSVQRSPYRDASIGAGPDAIRALIRDPVSTHHVWSRDAGYPGGAAYREFHKLTFPGGLRLWSVTHPGADLGDKLRYDPAAAQAMAAEHARHFAGMLEHLAQHVVPGDGAIIAPFDAELFGHWWFEGPQFLDNLFAELERREASGAPPARCARAHVHATEGLAEPVRLTAGSWGRDGDFSYWLNANTAWTWERLWALEARFWPAARRALAWPGTRDVLAQAARELLLAQSSDWQFMISAGAVADYAVRRFEFHASAAEELVGALEPGGNLHAGRARAAELHAQDGIFPDVLESVDAALHAASGVP